MTKYQRLFAAFLVASISLVPARSIAAEVQPDGSVLEVDDSGEEYSVTPVYILKNASGEVVALSKIRSENDSSTETVNEPQAQSPSTIGISRTENERSFKFNRFYFGGRFDSNQIFAVTIGALFGKGRYDNEKLNSGVIVELEPGVMGLDASVGYRFGFDAPGSGHTFPVFGHINVKAVYEQLWGSFGDEGAPGGYAGVGVDFALLVIKFNFAALKQVSGPINPSAADSGGFIFKAGVGIVWL